MIINCTELSEGGEMTVSCTFYGNSSNQEGNRYKVCDHHQEYTESFNTVYRSSVST